MTDTPTVRRRAYFISDSTGITVEGMGKALLNQFSNVQFKCRTYPFIDTLQQARELLQHIAEEIAEDGWERPLVFSSVVNSEVRQLIHTLPAYHVDFYDTFIENLEKELNVEARRILGATHGLNDTARYDARMEAVNFSLRHDDGITDKDLSIADIILVGVSRAGKTPTCLYLALQYGIRAANYPLIPDDLESLDLPRMIKPYKNKLFGLTIDSSRLQKIRNERRPDSNYASLKTCIKEVTSAEELFMRHNIPFLVTTDKSVEELAASILTQCKLKRRF